jgi:hypothetical protein
VGLDALAASGWKGSVEQVGDQVDQLPADHLAGRCDLRRFDNRSGTPDRHHEQHPTSSAPPVSSQPVRGTPCSRPSQPSARTNGGNSTHDVVPAPDDTPARMVEGTASCNSRPA